MLSRLLLLLLLLFVVSRLLLSVLLPPGDDGRGPLRRPALALLGSRFVGLRSSRVLTCLCRCRFLIPIMSCVFDRVWRVRQCPVSPNITTNGHAHLTRFAGWRAYKTASSHMCSAALANDAHCLSLQQVKSRPTSNRSLVARNLAYSASSDLAASLQYHNYQCEHGDINLVLFEISFCFLVYVCGFCISRQNVQTS